MQIHLLRLLWLVPIFFISGLFEAATTGALFALCMSFASGKIFPIFVHVQKKETK